MRSQIIALGLAGSAFASYAPPAPAYKETTSSVPSYGAETSTYEAPVYPTPSVEYPPVYETPSAPGYESTSEYSSETKPAYYPTASVPAEYPTTTEYTTIPCESTTVTYGSSTWVVSTETTLIIPVTKPVYSVPTYAPSVSKSTPYSPEQPSSSVDVPVYGPTSSATWTTQPVSPYYPTGGNGTATILPTGASSTYPASYTGAASKAAVGVMVGVSGLLAALFL